MEHKGLKVFDAISNAYFVCNLKNKVEKFVIEIVSTHNGYWLFKSDFRIKTGIIASILRKHRSKYSRQSFHTLDERRHFAKVLEDRNQELLAQIKHNKLLIQLCKKQNIEIIDLRDNDSN